MRVSGCPGCVDANRELARLRAENARCLTEVGKWGRKAGELTHLLREARDDLRMLLTKWELSGVDKTISYGIVLRVVKRIDEGTEETEPKANNAALGEK